MRSSARAAAPWVGVLALLILSALALASYRSIAERGITFGEAAATPINHSDAPPIGANTFLHLEPDQQKIRRELNILKSVGVGIIRQQFLWEEIEPVKGRFWDERINRSTWERYDTIVREAREAGLEILARLERPPRWATPLWNPANPASQKPPDNLEEFGEFVYAVASRYQGSLRYIQIWNEPNLWGEWGESPPDAGRYVQMLKIAHLRAKDANPNVVIVAAGLAPTTERGPNNISDLIYLQRMYDLGAKEHFDVASSMSYGLFTGPRDLRVGERWTNFPRVILWREIMEVYGDRSKPIWASEYGWMALPDGWTGRPSIWGNHSVSDQALWTVDGIRRARDQWPWLPTIFIWASRWPGPHEPEDPTRWFRLMDADFTPRPALKALQEYAAPGPSGGVGFHPENHPSFRFRGPWPREPSDDAAGGFWATTGVAGATADFAFEGDSIDLVSRRGPDMGMLRVRIDGLDALADLAPRNQYGQAVVDLYSPGVESQARFRLASRLPPGRHNLELISLGVSSPGSSGARVIVDGLIVSNQRPLWPYAAAAVAWLAVLAAAIWMLTQPLWNRLRKAVASVPIEPAILGNVSWFGIPLPSLIVAASAAALLGLLPGAALVSLPSAIRAFAFIYLLAVALRRPHAVAVLLAGLQPFHGVRPRTGPVAFSLPEIVLGALAIAWFLRGAYKRRLEAHPSWMLYIGAYFAIATLASAAFAEYPKFAFRTLRTTVIAPTFLFFLLTAYLRGRQAAALALAIAGGILIAALPALFDPLTGRVILAGVPRLRGIYSSPNNLALLLERALPILVGFAAAFSQPRLRRAFAAASALTLAILLGTFSRGAWLASTAGVALQGALPWLRMRPRGKLLAIGALLVPVSALAAIVGIDQLTVLCRAGDPSGVSRIWLWRSSLQMIGESPVFGVGPDNFLYQYPSYLQPEAWREPNLSHPHNLILDAWLSSGIFGTAALIGAVVLFFVHLAKAYQRMQYPHFRPLIIAVAASMTAALAHGFVDNFYFLPELAGIFWSSMAFAVMVRLESSEPPTSSR